MIVKSLNIGKRRRIEWNGRIVETGIFKFPVKHAIELEKEDVKNDHVVDRIHHGGIDQAVYGYSEKHYEYFKKLYPDLEWKFGMFGENITFSELEEKEIHVRDIYKLGSCVIQVTKPRQPCFKLGIRFNDPKIIEQFWKSTKSGVYFKVLQTGSVQAGDALILQRKSVDSLTIAQVYNSKKSKKYK